MCCLVRLCDVGVRNRALFREKTQERAANLAVGYPFVDEDIPLAIGPWIFEQVSINDTVGLAVGLHCIF